MIKSMTGFGRAEVEENDRKVTIEVKSVNHRFLETGIRLPKGLSSFESKMKAVVKEYATRGKVDLFVGYEDYSDAKVQLKYNKEAAQAYMQIFAQMADDFNISQDMTVAQLSKYPEVITTEEVKADDDEIWAVVEKALRAALEEFVDTRVKEGEHLKTDLISKLEHMKELVDRIEERSPEIMKAYRERIEGKIAELLGDTQIDEGRIAQEVVIYADKICVDEETVRLKSHMDQAIACLKSAESVGRKLDFIAQEMNREANTILSKIDDVEISSVGIELKTDIEKVREQIQNIE